MSAARRLTALAAAVALSAQTACLDPASSLGKTPAAARANSDALFGSLAARFGVQHRDESLIALRTAISRYALTPSRLANDSSLWTSYGEVVRTAVVSGGGAPGDYTLRLNANAPLPARPAEYRRIVRLGVLGDGEYEWRVRDELAVGSVTGDDLAAALAVAFGVAQVSPEREIRQAYRAGLPHLTERLGRLFTLDTVRTAPLEGGAVLVMLSATMRPDRLDAEFPNFARYLRKYVDPSTFRLVVHDDLGGRWWELDVADRRVMLRAAVRNGALTPLNVSPRRIPQHLRVHMDASTKFGPFTVGIRRLRGDVTLTRAPNENGFEAHFRTVPDWRLPPLVERLIRSPLRRPFEGDGAVVALSVADRAGAQTIVARDYALAVKESAIMRWFGGLGRRALDDFRRGAEREADIYYGQVLGALHRDVLALLGGTAAQAVNGN
ncbi:MAG: hypothetical protein ACREON_05490 [Gemmatimonadaceae bacterium]